MRAGDLDNGDDSEDGDLPPKLFDDDPATEIGARRVAAGSPTAASDQLAASLEGLEQRLQAALERQTLRLLAAMHERRTAAPMQRIETRKSSAGSASFSSRPSTINNKGYPSQNLSHSMLGVRHWHSDSCASDDIIVEPDDEPADSKGLGSHCRDVRWQWQSSIGPWKDYEDSAHERIEAAYRLGQPIVRLKSGPTGKVPMEIFFVDMVQRDPESKRVRKVRRRGQPLSLREHASRYGNGLWRYMTTGRSMFESMQAYRDRTFWHSGYIDELERDDNEGTFITKMSWESLGSGQRRIRQICRQWIRGHWFSPVSAVVVLLQCWWIWYSTDDTVGVPLYQQGALANVLEHFFCFFFGAEFAINLLALNKRRLWYMNPWLSLDAACVCSSTLDVLLLPPISWAAGRDLAEVPGGEVLRSLRLVKMFRICRIFGYSHTYSTIIKGMVGGMRSAAFILALLSVVLFAFAVLMRTNSDQELLRPYFGTVPRAMRTLLTRGLFLDGVRVLIDDMFETGFWMPIIFFAIFMYVTFFGLMSMLVGAFCSVAERVHQQEEDRLMTSRLRSSLRDIVECYMDDESDQPMISQTMFWLLLKNPDVRALLKSSQTDIRGLRSVMKTLLANSDTEMPFSEMLDIIVHLRVGKSAAVSDVAHLEGFVWSSLERLESLILSGCPPRRGSDEPCSEADAYPSEVTEQRNSRCWEASGDSATIGARRSLRASDDGAEQ